MTAGMKKIETREIEEEEGDEEETGENTTLEEALENEEEKEEEEIDPIDQAEIDEREDEVEEEERRSKYEVYHGEDSIGKRALQRVLLKKQLDAMGAELREIMVYQSPPELGALWTEVQAMMEVVGKEQAVAIGIEMRRSAEAARQKHKQIKKIKYKVLCWGMSSMVVLYLCWLVWAVVEIRKEQRPELGRCLIPKGTPGYVWYNNLKWIDCEIR
jgi:hypothetical protein